MDTLKFEIVDIKNYLDSNDKIYNISLKLNDVAVCNGYTFDALDVVVASRFDFAEFYMFTCSCGVPGCAGFHDQVTQKKNGDVVTWYFPTENYYKTEKFVYEFDRALFEEAFTKLYNEMLRLETENTYHEVFLDDRFDDEDEEQFKFAKIKDREHYCVNSYRACQTFWNILTKNASDLIDKSFIWVYEGKRGKYSTDLYRIICHAFNQYPVNKAKSVELGIKAVRQFLNGDNTMYMKILMNSYERFGEPVMGNADLNFYEETQQPDFDIMKMMLIAE